MEENYQEPVKVPWSSSDLILIFVLSITLVFAAGEILHWFFLHNVSLENKEAIFGLINTLLQDVLLIGLSIILIKKRYSISLREQFFQVRNRAEVIVNGIAGGVLILLGVMVVNVILAVILTTYFNYTPPQQKIITILLKSQSNWLFLAYAVLIVLVAPFVEEFFFRGLVFSYVRSCYGVGWGIVISSFFFGLVHMSAWAFTGTFLGGLALAYLFYQSKSLYTSILAHMVWNGIVTFLLYLTWCFA